MRILETIKELQYNKTLVRTILNLGRKYICFVLTVVMYMWLFKRFTKRRDDEQIK